MTADTQRCTGKCKQEKPLEDFQENTFKYFSKKKQKTIIYKYRKPECRKCENLRRSERSKYKNKTLHHDITHQAPLERKS